MTRHIRTTVAMAFSLTLAASSWAQTFSSGSTGSDGAYTPTASGDFDPVALGLNPAGDNIFNFTTINVPSGVTIRLRASKLRNKPVIWLATGNVTIAGTLNLSGETPVVLFNATDSVQIVQNRRPSEPGPGGYAGGLGAHGGVGPETGAGPGGGVAGQNVGTSTCHGGEGANYSALAFGRNLQLAPTYGNSYLVPLYGGSGGGGGWGSDINALGGTGGAGGGAIRIVSTTQIAISGNVNADGGNFGQVSSPGCLGGHGAGGAIHLIAPIISGNGTLEAQSLPSGFCCGPTGIVRFNTSSDTFGGRRDWANFFVGPLYNVPPNSATADPSLKITQVNGVNVPAAPNGQYLTPDVQINANTPVTVNLAASNIPLSTPVTLRITAETAGDQSITCTALTGSLASSTATCTATFPFSISIAALRATW